MSILGITSSMINKYHTLEASCLELSARSNPQNICSTSSSSCIPRLEAGQEVLFTDIQGKEIGKGAAYQVEGAWHGCNLTDTKTCIVDITELKTDGLGRLPNPSTETGTPFKEPDDIKVRNMRVIWDSDRVFVQK